MFQLLAFPKLYTIPAKIDLINNVVDTVGIDFGTTRCCVAVFRKNKIETVALENKGERLLPSYVGFDEDFEKCGQIVVDRLKKSPDYANSTVFDVKRILGKKFNEIEPKDSWPFGILEDMENPIIGITKNKDAITKYPEEVAAALLNHMKLKCEELQGKQLQSAVITVPATFTDSQKIATAVSARLAGWSEVRFLAEPIAAAIAYFVDKQIPNNFTTLIFDLGGGTLDTCIFKVSNNKLEIVALGGDRSLGGRDFDRLLFKYFEGILKEKFKVDFASRSLLKYKLMQICQDIKHTLSTNYDAG